jgi:DNA invertase Pin-like site-specific DNA recombinase
MGIVQDRGVIQVVYGWYGMLIGYARASNSGQSLKTQGAALKAAGVERIFTDKGSRTKSDRPQLAKAIASLEDGDTLLVYELDRLARSVRDLLSSLLSIKAKGANLQSIAEPWADTASPDAGVLLQILTSIAKFEESRTATGIKDARARGVKFGRPPVLTPRQRAEALTRKAKGESLRSIAARFNVSHTTISRL